MLFGLNEVYTKIIIPQKKNEQKKYTINRFKKSLKEQNPKETRIIGTASAASKIRFSPNGIRGSRAARLKTPPSTAPKISRESF